MTRSSSLYALMLLNVIFTSALRLKEPQHENMEAVELKEGEAIEDFFVRELLESPHLEQPKRNITVEEIGVGVGCSVGKNGTLEYGLKPSSIIDTEEYTATIEKETFVLRFPENIMFKQFTLQAIQMPLETMDRSRECFRMYYKKSPITFCAQNTTERDSWMSDLTEAVFCINSAKEITPPKLESGEAVVLPPKSTKDERWEETLQEAEKKAEGKEEEAAEIPEPDKGKETMEVEIKELLEGKPQVFINGEKLPLFTGKKRKIDDIVEEDET